MSRPYKLTFLPLFEKDLNEIVDYISETLHQPRAAQVLVDQVEQAIVQRSKSPTGYPAYPTQKIRPLPYYTIRVKRYTIFYVLIGQTMEVRRILYQKRDCNKLL